MTFPMSRGLLRRYPLVRGNLVPEVGKVAPMSRGLRAGGSREQGVWIKGIGEARRRTMCRRWLESFNCKAAWWGA
jgi:hypothetical protein